MANNKRQKLQDNNETTRIAFQKQDDALQARHDYWEEEAQMAIVEHRDLDTDQVFIQNHSEEECKSLRYQEGETYEAYLKRNDIRISDSDSLLYMHDKYTDEQWAEIDGIFKAGFTRESASEVGRKIASLSFVGTKKEAYNILGLNKIISPEAALPYFDGVSEHFRSLESEISPIMKQFYDLKAKHPDAMLLFRCGDFYEVYEKDADTASKVLGITLTWRKNYSADFQTFKGAMAAFPYHALDTYLPKLIRAGLRVAICDQLEAPKKTVKRGITELVSPAVKMQVIDRISSLLPAEKTLMSQIVMDLETGNHLLGRSRSKEYWDFAAEHGGAVRALKEGAKLTERQRDIMLERAYNYHGGIAELAAMLNMDEQQLRKALIYDAVKEHRIEQNFRIIEDGQFCYVDARHGLGVSRDFAEKVAQVHNGERSERDGRLMYRFRTRDDATNFVHNIGLLNERYTNVLRDSFIEKMRKAGIDVNTDWEEGERVLAQENNRSVEQKPSGIYSDEFKQWFGDVDMASLSFPIYHVNRHIFSGSGKEAIESARKWAKDNLARVYSSEETGGKGEIFISKRAIDKYLEKKAVVKSSNLGVHLAALMELPGLIRVSFDLEQHPDYYKIDDSRSPVNGVDERYYIHRLYGAAQIDDDIYRVKITLKEDLSKRLPHKAYSYEIVNLEILENKKMEVYAASRRDLANAIQSYNDNDSITFISGANLLKNVELSYRSGEKLLDVSQILTEKGEPMVFYHGTNRAFDEFDLSKSSGMAMFTSSEALAKQFAGRWPMYDKDGNLVTDENGDYKNDGYVMSVYLNVRNPKVIDMEGYDWFGNGVGDNAGKSINKGRKTNFSYLEAKKAQKEGYDGLILRDVTDGKVKSDHVIVFNANQIKFVQNVGTYRLDSNNIYEHRVIESSAELSTVLAGEITRKDVERAMDSHLVKSWLKTKNSGDFATMQGFNMFGIGTTLIHEFAKARLGIDNKFEAGTNVFNNSWEILGNILEFAKEKGLDVAIADKYDLHFGSEDVKLIMEHPESIYTEDEFAAIEKVLSPTAFDDFKAVVRSFSEAKAIQAEEERIKNYNGGEALTKAFVLYDIAQRRLFAKHEGDERWFRRSEYIIKADGTTAYGGVNQKPKLGETLAWKWVLKSSVAAELMHVIATSPVSEKVPLLEIHEEQQTKSDHFKEWFGDWEKPSIYRAYMVDDVASLKDRYPSELPNKFYDHSTVTYGLQALDDREGQQKRMHIIGRLTTGKVDVLVVDNPESYNEYAHITLATAAGVKPIDSNAELEKHAADIVPLDDYVDVTFKNVLNRHLSKVVDADGKPLVVEHGTHADFTVFDINKLGENSKDNGLFGAGFYFGTHAPAWLNDGSEDYRIMKVYLDIKHPFEIKDGVRDIYTEVKEKLDTPAMCELMMTGMNDKQMTVGEYIYAIKAVDDLIEHNPVHVNGQIEHDEELQSYHPKDRLQMWRERVISRLTGMGVLGMSWQVVISEHIGSKQFTAAAIQDGYDGVIVDRGHGYKEYVAFEPTQIKSATENIGLFNRENADIRYQFTKGDTSVAREAAIAGIGQADYAPFLDSKALYDAVTALSASRRRMLAGYEDGEIGCYVFVGNAADYLGSLDAKHVGTLIHEDDLSRPTEYVLSTKTAEGRAFFDMATFRATKDGYSIAIIDGTHVEELVSQEEQAGQSTQQPVTVQQEDPAAVKVQAAVGLPHVKGAIQLTLPFNSSYTEKSDDELLAIMKAFGVSDAMPLGSYHTSHTLYQNEVFEVYDRRHRDDYDHYVTQYSDMMSVDGDGRMTLDEAYKMYDDVLAQLRNGAYATPERTKLMAQVSVIENAVQELESQREADIEEQYEEICDALYDKYQDSNEVLLNRYLESLQAQYDFVQERIKVGLPYDDLHNPEEDRDIDDTVSIPAVLAKDDGKQQTAKQHYQQQQVETRQLGYDLSGLSLRPLVDGEVCYVERRYTETGAFSFVAGEHVETDADVAYIFKALEDKSVENSFICMVKDGIPTIIHLGIGSSTAVMAPLENALVAFNELKPDKIWHIHNHPSGKLKVSNDDLNLQKRLEKIFGHAAQPGIIINTTSGKFLTYTGDADSYNYDMPEQGGDTSVKVWSFDRQVFSKDWNPESSFKANSSVAVAKFVSSHRLGEHAKLSLLITDNYTNITGNVFLPWTDIKDVCQEDHVRLIARYVQQMGGTGCFLYGSDRAMMERETKVMSLLSNHLKPFGVTLYDVLSVDDKSYYSAHEQGIHIASPGERSIAREPSPSVSEAPAARRLTPADREAGGALVDQLTKMGIDVSTDSRENRRILKAAEKDMSEAGKLRFMKTAAGETYGFTYKNKICLDLRKLDAELVLHEFVHLWCQAMRRVNPENWQRIVDMMVQDGDWWRFVQDKYPELTDTHDIVEEVIAQYSGREGSQKLMAEMQRMQSRDASYSSMWGNIYQNIAKAIQDFWRHVGDSLNIHYKDIDDVSDMILKDFAAKVSPVRKVQKWLADRDKVYADAVENDPDLAAQLFEEALQEHIGNGITPFMAVDGYRGKLDHLARNVKSDNPIIKSEAINEAADLMAPLVPPFSVLVPAPSHHGMATDMKDLAQAISNRTGAPVADVLKSDPRQSQYAAKRATGKPLTAEELGIRMEGQLPVHYMPVVIDNVVNSGHTAEACVKALGMGVVLSLASAVTLDRHAATLKSLESVVYDKAGKLIPLSERFELKNKYLGRVMKYKPIEDHAAVAQPSAVQGLEGYSREDIIAYVRNSVQEILDDQYANADIAIKDITIVGSRSRGEGRPDSDLDILLEYSGSDVREDSLFNLLHEAGNMLELEGVTIDINPINARYSLTTEQWLERDAQWRQEEATRHDMSGEQLLSDYLDNYSHRQEMAITFHTAMPLEDADGNTCKAIGLSSHHDGEQLSYYVEIDNGEHVPLHAFGYYDGLHRRVLPELILASVSRSDGQPATISFSDVVSVQLSGKVGSISVTEDGQLVVTVLHDDQEEQLSGQAVIDRFDVNTLEEMLSVTETLRRYDIYQKCEYYGLVHKPIILDHPVTYFNEDGEEKNAAVVMYDGRMFTCYQETNNAYDDAAGLWHNEGELFYELPTTAQVAICQQLSAFLSDGTNRITDLVDVVELPDYALGVVVNGDRDVDLSEEDFKNIDDFLAQYEDVLITPRQDASSFVPFPAFGLATDCTRTDITRVVTLDEMRQQVLIRGIAFEKVNHETEEMPYHISIGTDDRPGGVEGEFHVQFVKEINAVSFKEIQSLAEELGGSARIMNNQEWADFSDESSAVKFADKVVAMNAERIVAGRKNAGNERREQLRTLLGDVIGTHGQSIDIKPTDIGNHTVAIFLMNNNGTILFDGQVDGSPVMNRILDIDHLSIASAQFLMNSINNAKSMQKPLLPPLTDEQRKKMAELGYPFVPVNAKAEENAPVPDMIYWRVAAGMISSYEAVHAFATTGFTVGEDPVRTSEILTVLNDTYGKLDKYLQPLSEQRPVREGDNYTLEDILNKDDKFRYMLLSRMQSDVKYFLGNGNRHEPDLWGGNVENHLNVMYKLWDSLSEKPEWLTREQLDSYAQQMRQPSDVEKISALKKEPKDHAKSLYLGEDISNSNQQDTMTIEQVQEKAVKLFGNNFVFDFWNETEPGTKIDQIDLGGMPDTITIDKLVIKDGKLSLYSNDLAGDIDLQALDAVNISKVDASLGDIKEYLNAHQQGDLNGKQAQNTKLSPEANHETEEKPYHISIGTDDRPGGVEGEFHVQFVKEINAVSFKEIQSLAEELGGSARIMNNQEWADFSDEVSAVKFADKVVAMNAERENAGNEIGKEDIIEEKQLEESHPTVNYLDAITALAKEVIPNPKDVCYLTADLDLGIENIDGAFYINKKHYGLSFADEDRNNPNEGERIESLPLADFCQKYDMDSEVYGRLLAAGMARLIGEGNEIRFDINGLKPVIVDNDGESIQNVISGISVSKGCISFDETPVSSNLEPGDYSCAPSDLSIESMEKLLDSVKVAMNAERIVAERENADSERRRCYQITTANTYDNSMQGAVHVQFNDYLTAVGFREIQQLARSMGGDAFTTYNKEWATFDSQKTAELFAGKVAALNDDRLFAARQDMDLHISQMAPVFPVPATEHTPVRYGIHGYQWRSGDEDYDTDMSYFVNEYNAKNLDSGKYVYGYKFGFLFYDQKDALEFHKLMSDYVKALGRDDTLERLEYQTRKAFYLDSLAGGMTTSQFMFAQQRLSDGTYLMEADGNHTTKTEKEWLSANAVDGKTRFHLVGQSDTDAKQEKQPVEGYYRRPVRFHFVGVKGATNLDVNLGDNNISFLQQAKNLEGLGRMPESIKLDTGWEKGADGQWRLEIPAPRLFDPFANVQWMKEHPAVMRWRKLNQKETASVFGLGEDLSASEQQELQQLRERDDVKAFKPMTNMKNPDRLTVKDYIDAPDLFAAYPEVADIPVKISILEDGQFAHLHIEEDILALEDNDRKYTIEINSEVANKAWGLSVAGRQQMFYSVVHEIQHYVQEVEGFALGANEEMFSDKKADVLRDINFVTDDHLFEERAGMGVSIRNAEDIRIQMDKRIGGHPISYYYADKLDTVARKYGFEGYSKLLEGFDNLPTRFQQYAYTAGEVEARNVVTRMRLKMTREERRHSLAVRTEDVPRKLQSVHLMHGVASDKAVPFIEKVSWIVNSDDENFRRQMFGRISSCICDKSAQWTEKLEDNFTILKALWNTFPEGQKPHGYETMEDIEKFERRMLEKQEPLSRQEQIIREMTATSPDKRMNFLRMFSMDMEYYLTNGPIHGYSERNLSCGNFADQQAVMKALFESFPDDKKPEWITLDKIEGYQSRYNMRPPLKDGIYDVDVVLRKEYVGFAMDAWYKPLSSSSPGWLPAIKQIEVKDGHIVAFRGDYGPGQASGLLNPNDLSKQGANMLYDAVRNQNLREQAVMKMVMSRMREAGIAIFEDKGLAYCQQTLDKKNRRLLQSSGGAYGLVRDDGTIFIDTDKATAETPLHEFTHLWAEILRQANPREWKTIVELLRNTPQWQEVRQKYPHLQTSDEIAEEALALYSGRRGHERLMASFGLKESEGYDQLSGTQKDIFERISEAIARFWESIMSLLQVPHYESLDQVSDQIISDVMNRVNPQRMKHADAEKLSNGVIRPHFIGVEGAKHLATVQSSHLVDLLKFAEDAAAKGMDPAKIKMISGWEQGIDGKWRYEIANTKVKNMDIQSGTILGNVIDAPDIFRAYPELRNIKVIVGGTSDSAHYNNETKTITLNEYYTKREVTKEQIMRIQAVNDREIAASRQKIANGEDVAINESRLKELLDARAVLNGQLSSARSISEIWPDINKVFDHEVQHAIQYIEGFAVGDSLRTVADMRLATAQALMDKYEDVYNEYKDLEWRSQNEEDMQLAMDYYDEMSDFEQAHGAEIAAYLAARQQRDRAELDIVSGMLSEQNFEEYRRLAGEVEARNVSERRDMSVMERRSTLAAVTEDIPRDRQIIVDATKSNVSASVSSDIEKNIAYTPEQAAAVKEGIIYAIADRNTVYYHVDMNIEEKLTAADIVDKSSALSAAGQVCKELLDAAVEKDADILNSLLPVDSTLETEVEYMASDAVLTGEKLADCRVNRLREAVDAKLVELNALVGRANDIDRQADAEFVMKHPVTGYTVNTQSENSLILSAVKGDDAELITSWTDSRSILNKLDSIEREIIKAHPELAVQAAHHEVRLPDEQQPAEVFSLEKAVAPDEKNAIRDGLEQYYKHVQTEKGVDIPISRRIWNNPIDVWNDVANICMLLTEDISRAAGQGDPTLANATTSEYLSESSRAAGLEDCKKLYERITGLQTAIKPEQAKQADSHVAAVGQQAPAKEEKSIHEPYQMYFVPEGTSIKDGSFFKFSRGANAGKYAVSAIVDGKKRYVVLNTDDQRPEAAKAFKKDLNYFFIATKKGERMTAINNLVAKYFGQIREEYAVKQEPSAGQGEDTKKAKKPEAVEIRLSALLNYALDKASKGVMVNGSYMLQPALYGSNRPVSGFNALIMALHADMKGYKTAQYVNYKDAKDNGFSVKSGQKALPFVWYAWDKYVSTINPHDVISRERYESLDKEMQSLYTPHMNRDILSIYNLAQTTIEGSMHGDEYKQLVARLEATTKEVPLTQKDKVSEDMITLYAKLRENNPDKMIIMRQGNNYEIYGSDAINASDLLGIKTYVSDKKVDADGDAMNVVTFSKDDLPIHLANLVRHGKSVLVTDKNDCYISRDLFAKIDSIYDHAIALVNNMMTMDSSHVMVNSLLDTDYNKDSDMLVVNDTRYSEFGEELPTAVSIVNNIYREVIAYTGADDRLGRSIRADILPSDIVRHEALIQELGAAVLMLREGLPATVSEEHQKFIGYWQREMMENPHFINEIEQAVNQAVEVVDKLNQGNNVNYTLYRTPQYYQALNSREYSIVESLSDVVRDSTNIVVAKDEDGQSADVILPQGASLEVNNELPEVSKNRIVLALRKEGYQHIQFYNAGGCMALMQPNGYFSGKDVALCKMDNHALTVISRYDLADAIANTNVVEIEHVAMIPAENGRSAIYVKAVGEEPVVTFASRRDVQEFHRLKQGNSEQFDSYRQTLGRKYYNLLKEHPDLCADILMPKAPDVNVGRLGKVNIRQDKTTKEWMLYADIDGQHQQPIKISKDAADRFWLISDKEMYKTLLAAQLLADKLGHSEGRDGAQFPGRQEGHADDSVSVSSSEGSQDGVLQEEGRNQIKL